MHSISEIKKKYVPKKDSEWYSDNFKNTSSLPYTTIFKYMKQHLKLKQIKI